MIARSPGGGFGAAAGSAITTAPSTGRPSAPATVTDSADVADAGAGTTENVQAITQAASRALLLSIITVD